ncbi:MAG: hypothetical protein IPK81_10035 [Rhodospirillales bacterium]|nr:hypothetical protein [Rhodospirillales bacterium]QQS14461.1 MAG: hypothetical protein IPK81_10035 [Rhodospirillales bacterium]
MDDITIARAIHVLAVVHWIGGVALVTTVLLPAAARLAGPAARLALFEAVEGRFARQARISVALAGLSGIYMTHRLDAWDRFLDPAAWWMHAMALLWIAFTAVLFVAEPLFLHRWFHARAATRPAETFRLVGRAHWALLAASALTTAAAVAGAHGLFL